MDEWIAFAREAQQWPWVRALEVVVFSVLVARLVDLVITRFLMRLALRTETDLDDQLIQLLQHLLHRALVPNYPVH